MYDDYNEYEIVSRTVSKKITCANDLSKLQNHGREAGEVQHLERMMKTQMMMKPHGQCSSGAPLQSFSSTFHGLLLLHLLLFQFLLTGCCREAVILRLLLSGLCDVLLCRRGRGRSMWPKEWWRLWRTSYGKE